MEESYLYIMKLKLPLAPLNLRIPLLIRADEVATMAEAQFTINDKYTTPRFSRHKYNELEGAQGGR